MKNNVLFLTLRIFSATGGIEKVCRIAGKALHESSQQTGARVDIFCMYGTKGIADGNKYFPSGIFTGFAAHKIKFVRKSIQAGRKSGVVLLSHINLLVVGYLIKLIKPSTKLILLAHGIEVWRPLPSWKKRMLRKCDLILPVSRFTKDTMKLLYQLPEEKLAVLNNCLDPFLQHCPQSDKSEALLQRYGFNKNQTILLTVARLSVSEQYKGYDKVIESLPALQQEYPDIRYLIVGKYEEEEKQRLQTLTSELRLEKVIQFAGFVADEELADHYNLADIYVMPSSKEGFGIAFIEAMFYGLPVIAGNKDGSVDALLNGELGLLVDPGNKTDLISAIKKLIDNKQQYLPDQKKLEANFSYKAYKEKLNGIIGAVAG